MTKRMAIWEILSGTFAVLLFQTHPSYPQWAQILDAMVYGFSIVLLIYADYKSPMEFRATTIIYVIAPSMHFISTGLLVGQFIFSMFSELVLSYSHQQHF